MPHQPDTLRLIPGPDAVTVATQWLETIAEREGWPPKVNFGLTLSLDEALTNIVSYAFAGAVPDGSAPAITLEYTPVDGDLSVEIADNGQPFDPTQAATPELAASLEETDEGGHGLRLMRHYLKAMHYRRDGAWNRLTLIASAS
jgi:anti-sigma regulatory factor (Ser/Thr protein kinase)